MMDDTIKTLSGKRVFLYFAAFFALIIAVNAVFIYKALGTHTGVITEQPYEKGLAFNAVLDKSKAQPDIVQKVSYVDGILRWKLPIENAKVSAVIMRLVQDGYDFEVAFTHIGNGVYEAIPNTPFPGAWTAKMKATWNNTEFQTSHDFIVK